MDEWNQTSSMSQERGYAAGVQMSPNEWWVSGRSRLQSSEIYTVDSRTFSPYVDLPEARALHTIVQVNSTHFMLVGGDYTNKAWMFDRSSELWTPLPNQLEDRYAPQAGLVTHLDGHQVVIVAGGQDTKTSEIFDLAMQTWRYGPDLPVSEELNWGASVQHGDTFLIIGGYDNGYSDSILSFDATLESWVELPQKLTQGRSRFAAFLVPEDFVTCV